MKKILIIGGSCVLAYVIYAVFTGGLVLERSKNFGGQRNVIFAEGLKSDLWIDPNHSGGGIPFVGFYYFNQLPCSLRIQIWDREKKYTSITVDTVVVEYASGEKKTVKTNWNRKLQSYEEMMMLSDTTTRLIEHYSDCVVKLTGFMTTVTGNRIQFEVVEPFEYESHFVIYTFWQMIARM